MYLSWTINHTTQLSNSLVTCVVHDLRVVYSEDKLSNCLDFSSLLQLLMVPTPFFVGVCTSFMKKVNEVHRSETWVVDLDNKEVGIVVHVS